MPILLTITNGVTLNEIIFCDYTYFVSNTLFLWMQSTNPNKTKKGRQIYVTFQTKEWKWEIFWNKFSWTEMWMFIPKIDLEKIDSKKNHIWGEE